MIYARLGLGDTDRYIIELMELVAGFEPATSSLPRTRSTPELHERATCRGYAWLFLQTQGIPILTPWCKEQKCPFLAEKAGGKLSGCLILSKKFKKYLSF